MKMPGRFIFGLTRTSQAFWACSILILSIFLASCSDSTDPIPTPDDLSFQYIPEAAVNDYYIGDSESFSLSSTPSVTLEISWTLNGEPAGQETVFQYNANHVGIDTLRVEYSYSSVSWNRTWYADVLQNPSTAPGEIPWVILEHGPEPSDVLVRWHSIPESTFLLEGYEIRMSYGGEVTSETWASSTLLGDFPVDINQVGYSEVFSEAEHGMIPGAEAWFAVRGYDEVGQLSPLTAPQYHLISLPWYIQGYVYSDQMEPLPEVIVDYGCPSCRVNTDANGFYSIGPLPNVNNYDLITHSSNTHNPEVPETSWYDFTMRDVVYDPIADYDIIIATRYELDPSCTAYSDEYIVYFKYMTNTMLHTNLRPNNNLYKWEEYPVPVYIPPFINEHDLDFEALCRETVSYWNLVMGEEYLYLVDTPEESRIEMYFGNEGIQYTGRTLLAEPSDENYGLGDVIPEKIRVYVWDQLSDSMDVQETSMHELGHALGLYGHALCDGEGFIMVINSAGILDNGPENAAHHHERRAIEMIRNLPQGTNMADFQY